MSDEPIQPVDHNDLQELLLEQYKWRTDTTPSRITNMISMLASEMNLVEDAIQELLTAFDMATAIGVQLDMLGAIFGAPLRNGATDSAYRITVQTAALKATSGTPEQLIAAIRGVVGGVSPIRLLEVQPAKVYAYTDTGAITGITVAQIRPTAVPAGVQLIFGDLLALHDGTTLLGDYASDSFLVGA
jgi:hypothetical protein